MSDVYTYIGKRIRILRTERKITQSDLAEYLRLSRTSITNLEAGTQRLNLDELYKLAQFFEVELTDIVPPVSAVMEIPQHRLEFRKTQQDVRQVINGLIKRTP